MSHNKIGDVLVQGNLPAALTSYQAWLDIRERLAEADPGNAGWQRDLIVSLSQVAAISPDQTRPCLRRALEIARDLHASGRLPPTDHQMIEILERRLKALGPEARRS